MNVLTVEHVSQNARIQQFYEGADDWKHADGTDLTGNIVLPNGKAMNAGPKRRSLFLMRSIIL